MNGFFDFLDRVPHYAENPGGIDRLNKRHAMLVAPLAAEFAGARVLDLGAHDGRWSHAFAAAGAARVVGLAGRAEIAALYADFPDAALKGRVELRTGDLFAGMERLVEEGARFDIVAVLGIFYHVVEHHRLLQLVAALGARLVLVDGEFALRPGATVLLSRERTDRPMNAIPQVPGQAEAVIGVPSRRAMEVLASASGFGVEWIDWQAWPAARRANVGDYYRRQRKRRGSCLLRPLPRS